MGGALAERVVGAGFDLSVFDIRPEMVERLVKLGAQGKGSPGETAEGADVIGVVVRDDDQVRHVVSAPDGILASARPGSVIAVHSTIALETLREAARAAEAKGVRLIDAAVSGGASGARAGRLCVMAGGDEDAFNQARPVLDSFGGLVLHLGPLGRGMAMKLARNLTGYVVMAAAHEGMVLAERSGLPLEKFRQVLEYTDQVTGTYPFWLARPTTEPADPVRDPDTAQWAVWGSTLAEKDLRDALELAGELGVELPVTTVAARTMGRVWRVPATGDGAGT
jgi:3-hydroxyisobutyrate dehydrogenase-like beta-hydroxyacid dehydrogenase